MDNIDGLQVELQDYPRYGEEPYVGLGQLLLKIEQAMEHNYGNGVVSGEINLLERTVGFVVERTASTPLGLHCGTETYTASLPFHKLNRSWIVFPSEMDIEWTPAEPERTYTRDEAVEFLNEMYDDGPAYKGSKWREELDMHPTDNDILELAFLKGLTEGDYAQPDADFAWQHLHYGFLEPMVNEIKAEREKLHADAALRRAGIRTDLTKEQLAAIRSAGVFTCGRETFCDTAKSEAAAETAANSCGTDGHLAMAIGDMPVASAVTNLAADLGFNPWTDKRYGQLRPTQTNDSQNKKGEA